jgi:hypothetical protein
MSRLSLRNDYRLKFNALGRSADQFRAIYLTFLNNEKLKDIYQHVTNRVDLETLNLKLDPFCCRSLIQQAIIIQSSNFYELDQSLESQQFEQVV